MTKQQRYTRKYLEETLISLKKQDDIELLPEQAKAMDIVNLVYAIQFLLIKFNLETYDQDEIDSLIYH